MSYYWTLASLLVLAMAAGVVVLLFRDVDVPRPSVRRPEWLVPASGNLRESRFTFAWQGYDPEEVDVFLEHVAAAYEELVLAAGPSAVARAESRVAARLGRRSEELSAGDDPAT